MENLWLYLYAAGVLCIGFAWINPTKNKEETKEVSDPSLIEYFQTLEKEHQHFMETLSKLQNVHEEQFTALKTKVAQLELQMEQMQRPGDTDVLPNASHNHADSLLLHNRYKEIFELQKQGMDKKEIARKLDIGNGEVELIIQLAEQRGESDGNP